ncbi:MAG: RiPP maturation radical SAM C-methyltransferase [Spirochaetaceae bacterium]
MNDLLLIVPPFFSPELQSLGLHNLQACARKEGFSTDIKYVNFELARRLGDNFKNFCVMNYFQLGERIFAKAAWGDLVGEQFYDGLYDFSDIFDWDRNPVKFFDEQNQLTIAELKKCEKIATSWLLDLEEQFKDLPYKYVGISSSYEQINAGIALFKIIKRLNPEIITFIGGFNCEEEMAKGIASLDSDRQYIDYIFSGESEISLINFLKDGGSKNRIIRSELLQDMNIIPDLDYSDYFNQLNFKTEHKLLVMEHSRGCWWGEKTQCKFCGVGRLQFRKKNFDRIKTELENAKKWGIKRLHMADLAMPDSHLTDLLPHLIDEDYGWEIYFEQKVSLNYEQLKLLKKSGVNEIQPGIETLSDNVLKKMSKGTSMRQNLTFLRDGTSLGLEVLWNIVWGIPGETIEDYREMNKLIPLLVHLMPPVGIFHMTLVRFSPYFNNPKQYGITNIKPIKSYYDVYPDFVDIDNLAMIFKCEHNEENLNDKTELIKFLELLESWNSRWENNLFTPKLEITKLGDGTVILLDTRGIEGCEVKRELSPVEIELLLYPAIYTNSDMENMFIENKVAILDDGFFIPLVIITEEMR